MPYGSINSSETSGSTYSLRLIHTSEPTMSIQVTMGLGDSGADDGDGDPVFQEILDMFDANPNFTISEAHKMWPSSRDVTPTP